MVTLFFLQAKRRNFNSISKVVAFVRFQMTYTSLFFARHTLRRCPKMSLHWTHRGNGFPPPRLRKGRMFQKNNLDSAKN